MNDRATTKERILDAAEALFAERGFAETSLRSITTRAEVNLASVNYHFGSKKALIQAVFDRFMVVFTDELMREMARLENQSSALDMHQVLTTLVKPLLKLEKVHADGATSFMKLLGKAYAETQGHIRRFAMDNYAHVFARFTRLLHKACPHVAPNDMFWRLHFTLGSIIFSLSGHEALQEIAEADFNEKVSVEEIIGRLIPFLAAAFEHRNAAVEFRSAGEG